MGRTKQNRSSRGSAGSSSNAGDLPLEKKSKCEENKETGLTEENKMEQNSVELDEEVNSLENIVHTMENADTVMQVLKKQ